MTAASTIIRSVSRAVATQGPFHFIFFVTARCNARCRMCFYLDEIEQANANLHKELSLDEIKRIFSTLGFVPYFSLSGGEPFLRPDLFEIIDAAAGSMSPMAISTPTNGSMPERVIELYDKICPLHPDVQFEVQVSLDGVGEVHDRVRRVPGLFGLVLETLTGLEQLRAKHANLKVKIVATYSTFNDGDVAALIDYAGANLAFDRMILAWTHGNCDAAAKHGLDYDRYREMLARVETLNQSRWAAQGPVMLMARAVKRIKERNRLKWDRDQSLGRFCNAGRKIIVLSEQGEVHPCEPLAYSMGNIRAHDFDLGKLMADAYAGFTDAHPPKACHCDWGCVQNVAVASHPRFWFNLL